jgi:hypothetical protein
MALPFGADDFLDVFRRYNEAVWPAQWGLAAAGLFAAFAAHRAGVRHSRRWAVAALGVLSALWLWSGVVFHKLFFSSLTPAGQVFGSLFVAEAALLLLALLPGETFTAEPSRASVHAGSFMIAYALVLYPLLGMAAGQRYPAMPTFGAPCPIAIFTFGLFCLLPGRIPRFAVAVPVVWAVIASFAAIEFGVVEDLALIPAAAAAIAAMHHDGHRPRAARAVA